MHDNEDEWCDRHVGTVFHASGCDQATVQHKPHVPADNCASQVTRKLADWLGSQNMDQVRGAPYLILKTNAGLQQPS